MGFSWGVLATVATLLPFFFSPVQDEPRDSPAFTRLGVMTIREGRYEEGIKSLDKALKLDGKNGLAYYWCGRANASLGSLKEAVKNFDEAIRLNPTDPTAYVNRAAAKRELKDNTGAAEDMKIAATLGEEWKKAKPELPRGKEVSLIDLTAKLVELPEIELKAEKILDAARIKMGNGDFKGSIADCDEAIKLSPRLADAYSSRAFAKYNLKDYRGAIDDCTKAIDLNPGLVRAYNHRGAAKAALGDYEGEIADSNKAIELNPRYASAYNNRSFAKASLGRFKEALDDADRAIEISTTDSTFYYNRAGIRGTRGDHDGAIADYTRALDLSPDKEERESIYVGRATSKMKKGMLDDGESDCKEALKLNPRSAEAHGLIGMAKCTTGDYRSALTSLEKALELKPSLKPHLEPYIRQAKAKLQQ